LDTCLQVLQPRPGMWDGTKVGISAPPLRIKEGWLLLYHGVSEKIEYRLGAALLDKNDPTVVLARTSLPIFEPEEPYEREGIIPNVVFPCGAVIRGDTIYIYYGGADKVVGVATASLKRLVTLLKH
jgi:beta-1,2-mannobiose phosphorylase / 1,2-beta-oligomannan phosphorylase